MENTKFWQNEEQKKISVGMANDIVNLKRESENGESLAQSTNK